MASLHDELLGRARVGRAKFARSSPVSTQPPRAEWQREIAMPITDITHTAIVVALKRRNISIEEASVRRHRANHV
jgi:hypothetical protein